MQVEPSAKAVGRSIEGAVTGARVDLGREEHLVTTGPLSNNWPQGSGIHIMGVRCWRDIEAF